MNWRALDWRTVLMAPPKRRFTQAELQRAIPEPPSGSLRLAVVLNILLMIVALAMAVGRDGRPALLVLLTLLGLGTGWALQLAWRDPGHRGVRALYYGAPLVIGFVLGLAAGPLGLSRQGGFALLLAGFAAMLSLWFAIVYRHRFVEMRLAELDERDRAVEMARQLAAAQIQPHFLFNSLASLQHWVASKDDRAQTLLAALTGYLRATLPLFSRPRLPLHEEVQAVERYLEVMRLRLGERLHTRVQVDPGADAQAVPPGLLLTLVENAVEHGVTPSLRPVTVEVRVARQAGRCVVDVADDGVGFDPAALATAGGLGLANIRLRLRQTYGREASLTLDGGPGQGCRARLDLPDEPGEPA